MLKKLPFILLICIFVGCQKNANVNEQPVCGEKACTKVFATIGIKFTDAKGDPLAIKNFSAINQRTMKKLNASVNYDLMPGYYVIADDASLGQLSTAGDDILVSADHPNTGQVKTAMFKISGGCNCHVEKLSGPEAISF